MGYYKALLKRYLLPLLHGVVERGDGAHARTGHEADDGQQRRADRPRWPPRFRMVTRYAQANFAVHFETSVGL